METEERRKKKARVYRASVPAKARKVNKHRTLPKQPGVNATDRYAGNAEYLGAHSRGSSPRDARAHAVNPDDVPLGFTVEDDKDGWKGHHSDDWGESDEENASPSPRGRE